MEHGANELRALNGPGPAMCVQESKPEKNDGLGACAVLLNKCCPGRRRGLLNWFEGLVHSLGCFRTLFPGHAFVGVGLFA